MAGGGFGKTRSGAEWVRAEVKAVIHPSEQGTPQGGSISVLLSNLYLHYVLDLWFERVVKGRLRGEAQLVRYIDGQGGACQRSRTGLGDCYGDRQGARRQHNGKRPPPARGVL
jgi:hypothetical protein